MRVDVADVRFLFDPWLEGTAFSGGWGLNYENADALSLACEATHLWISHWHSDHMHWPTLHKIAAKTPDMVVLANVSMNFSMVDRLLACGFRNVCPIFERRAVQVTSRVQVTRFPTAGIDNMLLLQADEARVLNYNDCNLPSAALRALRKEMGAIDVLITNYNHAGKLFEPRGDEEIKNAFFAALTRAADAIEPRYVIPFASSHYYRTEESQAQNASLLDFGELERRTKHDPRFVILRVGDAVTLSEREVKLDRRQPSLAPAPRVTHAYGESIPLDALCSAATQRCHALGRKFPYISALVPPLIIRVSDHDKLLKLSLAAPAQTVEGVTPHIRAHSRALDDWHGRKFGDDTFFAGAHFEVLGEDARAIRTWALLTLLDASHLDPRSMLRYLTSARGREFLLNRREEIWFTLLQLQLKAGELRK
jgi:L-ascorbate metabolism protein UlaG (beta-lactamase superfamily)